MTPPPFPADPPEVDALEITVLGRGVGESVVVHLPGGRWLIVDSFRDVPVDRSAAVSYLRAIGTPASRVEAVVVTHPHRDHILKMDDVAATFEEAIVYQSVLSPSHDHKDLQRATVIASDDGRLAVLRAGDALFDGAVRVVAPDGTTPAPSTNLSCVVLRVHAAGTVVLLGADLEDGTGIHGWAAIDATEPASLVKIAHHGSRNGHHPASMNTLATREVGIATPNSCSKLPREEMVAELSGFYQHFHVAGPVTPPIRNEWDEGGVAATSWVRARVRAEDAHWRVDPASSRIS